MRRFLGAAVISAVLVSSGCASFLNSNFHEEVQGELFRSAQLSHSDLEKRIVQHDVGVVVNLRGEDDEEWYAKEVMVCKSAGVEFVDLRLSARRKPRKFEVLMLLHTYERARKEGKKVYVHCAGGADRTGLASAVYRLYTGQSLDEALESLNLWPYGHFSNGIDDFFEEYGPFEKKMSFQEWVETRYAN